MTQISLADRLHRLIASGGAIPVSLYMGHSNAAYYAARDPLGAAGDFVTAPEISQMFGELIGLWLADLWQRAGRPQCYYVELGPGRGTLAADALRAMRAAGLEPEVHLVETSPVLRAEQQARVPQACWHDDLSTVPDKGALLVVANEFFDALPIRQLERASDGWRERLVISAGDRFRPVPGPRIADAAVPEQLREAKEGSVIEASPASIAFAAELGSMIGQRGGAALIIDYGHLASRAGQTLQAVSGHASADPWSRPGEVDLTAHVDFQALGEALVAGGAKVEAGVTQSEFLRAIGIEARAARLSEAQPHRAAEIEKAMNRLIGEEEMGCLFKVLAATAPGWPKPAWLA